MTVAVDTNIIVRYLTSDDPVQTPIATQSLRRPFMVTATVLLETEWVLRSSYRWPRNRIVEALSELIDLPSAVSTPEGIRWALGRLRAGADFADMLHIASSQGADVFLSFEKQLGSLVGAEPPVPVETLS